ncbi:relaxase/mobilization nuclease domain-containing protein (plasmid) [Salinifilum ghardaiensis]
MQYLFSEGKYNEHHQPRLVASWDGQPQQWQPVRTGEGEFEFDLEPLARVLQAPAVAAGLPLSTPRADEPAHRRYFRTDPTTGASSLRAGYVYHVTLRNDDADRVLSDAEWGHIATEVMHRAGIARRDDPGGPRWVAVRHDETGIHIQATLVRQDTGRRVHPPRGDFARLRAACEQMEQRYGLTSTAPADRTAAPGTGRSEREKAARRGAHPARVQLRAAARQAAATSTTFAEFRTVLEGQGYLVAERLLPSGDRAGYTLARPGDVTADGAPVRYAGRSLAADLSLPKLEQRWAQARVGARSDLAAVPRGSEAWLRQTTQAVLRARQDLAHDPAQAPGMAHAAGEVLAALDQRQGMLLGGAGARWDRAARTPQAAVPPAARAAGELRSLARGLSAAGGSTPAALVELAAALTALGLQIAAVQQQAGRAHQARPARQAAQLVSRQVSQPAAEPAPAAPSTPVPAAPARPMGPQSAPSPAGPGGQWLQQPTAARPRPPRRTSGGSGPVRPPRHWLGPEQGPQRGR